MQPCLASAGRARSEEKGGPLPFCILCQAVLTLTQAASGRANALGSLFSSAPLSSFSTGLLCDSVFPLAKYPSGRVLYVLLVKTEIAAIVQASQTCL